MEQDAEEVVFGEYIEKQNAISEFLEAITHQQLEACRD